MAMADTTTMTTTAAATTMTTTDTTSTTMTTAALNLILKLKVANLEEKIKELEKKNKELEVTLMEDVDLKEKIKELEKKNKELEVKLREEVKLSCVRELACIQLPDSDERSPVSPPTNSMEVYYHNSNQARIAYNELMAMKCNNRKNGNI